MMLPPAVEVDRALVAKGGLAAFAEIAWPHLEPAVALEWNWHHDLICRRLEQVTRGEVLRLVVNIPPGCTKTALCSILWPAWVWTFRTEARWISASYSSQLATRDARKHRDLVASPWYQERWPCRLQDDVQASHDFANVAGGTRYATSPEGGGTGRHCHFEVVDDPIKPGDLSVSRSTLDAVAEWRRATMASRLLPGAARVLVMQRLHEADPAAHALEEDGVVHVRLPMEYEPDDPCEGDPRTEADELLWPARFSRELVDRMRREMGGRVSAAQLQQRPSPAAGSMFLREHVRYYQRLPSDTERRGTWCISVDCTFRDGPGSDFVAIQVWCAHEGKRYLVDQVRQRMGFLSTVAAIGNVAAQYPRAHAKLIEKAANGFAAAEALEKQVAGVILVPPLGSKESRAHPLSALWEAGDVLLPEGAPWVAALVEEFAAFPSGRHDDSVDAASLAINYLSKHSTEGYKKLVAAMKRPEAMRAWASVAPGHARVRTRGRF